MLDVISAFTNKEWGQQHRQAKQCARCWVVFAEFERSMIQERINSGLSRAKANGMKLGRLVISKKTEKKIMELRQSTMPPMGILKIAKKLGIGIGTVQKVIKLHEA